MKYCPSCGKEIKEKAKFCPKCGKEISENKSSETPKRTVDMIITTTDSIEGRKIKDYLGIVSGEAMMGANIVKDFTAGIRNIIGGRSGQYEETIRKGRREAEKDLEEIADQKGADAVVGASYDYEEMAEGMLWINVTGTAVKLE